uniref:SFRICE_027269 n=1 Tax=Spodoptera frugiperda TaxID=7108 RepID=A0A2H1V555_SPOFR
MSSAKKRRGKSMSYYDIVGPNKTEAQCKLCEKTFSIEAFTEIQEHLVDYHGEMPTDYICPKKPKVVFRRQYWRFFTKKEPFVATCKLCCNDYSYRTTISNLAHHLRNKHGVDMTGPASDSDSEGEIGNSFNEKKGAATWSFFDVLDSDKFEARCKICEKNIEYDSVEDLKKHVEDHGQHPQDSDDEVEVSKSRHFSELWKYFKKLDRSSNFALCLICKNVYNAQTISNLKKHLVTKHRDAEVPEEDEKKYIVASNGQLYEMESEKGDDNEDTEDKDPIEMDTVYLEDLEDFNTSRPSTPTPSPPKKKAKPIFPKPQSPAKPRNEQILNNSHNNENNRNNDTTPRHDDVEELLKVHDLWSFFQTDGRKSRCIICQDTVGKEYEDIKAHMKEHHPGVMLQTLQDKDNSDASSNEDERNTSYTEVVYLEKEPSPDPVKIKEKPKPKLIKKRRRTSVFDIDSPPKRRRDNTTLYDNDTVPDISPFKLTNKHNIGTVCLRTTYHPVQWRMSTHKVPRPDEDPRQSQYAGRSHPRDV